ncbi:MAG: hypothetical protein Q7T57_04880 [Dehalococcoidales bacterium]|nr:hypothetical protein [Dehalococcoidales bacterium]
MDAVTASSTSVFQATVAPTSEPTTGGMWLRTYANSDCSGAASDSAASIPLGRCFTNGQSQTSQQYSCSLDGATAAVDTYSDAACTTFLGSLPLVSGVCKSVGPNASTALSLVAVPAAVRSFIVFHWPGRADAGTVYYLAFQILRPSWMQQRADD